MQTSTLIVLSCLMGLTLIWHFVFLWFASLDYCALPRKIRDNIVAQMQQAQHTYHGNYSTILSHFAYLVPQGNKFALGDLLDVGNRLGLNAEKLMSDLDPISALTGIPSSAQARRSRRSDIVETRYAHRDILSRRPITRFHLEASARLEFARLFRELKEPEPELASVSQELRTLLSQVSNPMQAAFLEETIRCCEAKSYRAAIVMGWNVTYDQLLNWLLADPARLSAFNSRLTMRSRRGVPYQAVSKYEDFAYVQESEVIDDCRLAGLLDAKSEHVHLAEGLTKRNRYAHPNKNVATAAIAAGHLSALIEHIVLNPKFKS